MPDSENVEELRDKIAKLTGRVTASRNPRYLRNRLADLRSMKQTDRGEPADQTVMTISMHPNTRKAAAMMADKLRVTRSHVVRVALKALATANGWHSIVKLIDDAEVG